MTDFSDKFSDLTSEVMKVKDEPDKFAASKAALKALETFFNDIHGLKTLWDLQCAYLLLSAIALKRRITVKVHDEVKIVTFILEFMDHKKYDKGFDYKKK